MAQTIEDYFQLFSKTLNFAGIAWWIIDYENDPGHFVCNNEMARLFGLDPSLHRHSVARSCPIAGDYNSNIIESETRQIIFDDYAHLLSAKTDEYTNEFPYTDPSSGLMRHFRSRALMLQRQSDGSPSLGYGLIEDITSETENLERFKSLSIELEASVAEREKLIKELTAKHELLERAATFARVNLFKVDVETGTGEFIFNTIGQTDFMPADEWEKLATPPYREIARKVTTEGVDFGKVEYEVKLSGPDQPSVWLEQAMLVEQISDLGRLERIGISRDITRRIEEENRLKLMLERQKEMFAIIGHELRTPVAAVNMLAKDDFHSDSDKLDRIEEISANLLHVLEDLRVAAAPERALESKPVNDNPFRVIRSAIAPLEPLAREKEKQLQVTLHSEADLRYLFHAQPLRQTVTNLVKNAAIHSRGTKIHVSFELEKASATELNAVLKVEDDGVGIPGKALEQLLQPFSRGETDASGSGLGLFIISELAKVMSGTLTYSTSKHGGACFTLIFPLKAQPISEIPPDRPSTRLDIEGMRILLAEDDPMLRMLTTKMLGNRGAKVESFENGQLALNAFDEQKYDLVLTDLMMPILDGHALTKSLRAKGVTTPIIAVTAAVIGEETEQVLAAGANAFIPKPISADKLAETLSMIHREPWNA